MADDRDTRRYGGGADRPGARQGQERVWSGRDEQRGRDYPPRGDQGYPGERYPGERDRGGAQGDYGRDPRGYAYQERGFMDRAGDEVRSWFGDEDAERRRQADDRYGRREDRDFGRAGQGMGQSAFDRDRDAGYGASYGSGGGFGGDAGAGRGRHDHDPNYRSWRDRQMASLDQDYDEYRREHQSRFDSEFHSWRQGRQGQRDLLGKVQEHATVVGSDGQHVGTVDHVKGDQIELTKNDKDAGGRHHLIPSSWLQSVEGNQVMLTKTADEAKRLWRDEARDAGGRQPRY